MSLLGTPLSSSSDKIMLLGSGELGKEVLIALQRLGVETIDILKMDIEGAEKVIFENYQEDWLQRVGVLYVELHDRLFPGCALATYRAATPHPFFKTQLGEVDILDFRTPLAPARSAA